MSEREGERRGEVLEKTRKEADEPGLYKVILHNDDYTPMDFVVVVLESIFNKSPAEAYRVMMRVHQRGTGIGGVYPYEVAETKVALTHDRAREAGHPLHCSVEPE